MSIKFFSCFALLVFITGASVHAMDASVLANLNLKTAYQKCKSEADKVVELSFFYMQVNDALKPVIFANIEKNKSKLEECEEENEKAGGSGFSHD